MTIPGRPVRRAAPPGWTVRRVVRQGRAAPEGLRPAAYELADALVRFQDQSSWPPPRRVLITLLAGLYVVFFAGYALAGAGWAAAVFRPLPTVFVGAAALVGDRRQREKLRRARAANA